MLQCRSYGFPHIKQRFVAIQNGLALAKIFPDRGQLFLDFQLGLLQPAISLLQLRPAPLTRRRELVFKATANRTFGSGVKSER